MVNLKINNCTSPLKLTYSENLLAGYKVNKPFEHSGEYVDKAIADEMLDSIKNSYELIKNLYNQLPLNMHNMNEPIYRKLFDSFLETQIKNEKSIRLATSNK